MFRLIGFLIGSLTSIVIILLLVGMPNVNHPDEDAAQRRYDEAIERLKAKQREFESVAGKLSDDVARVSEAVQNGPPADHAPDTTDAAAVDTTPPPAAVTATPAAAATPATSVEWYAFWNPFRSKIAANGFVARLEQVTGIDYRVVKVKTGVYEVAFPYHDDEERRDKLARIAAATGLELPES